MRAEPQRTLQSSAPVMRAAASGPRWPRPVGASARTLGPGPALPAGFPGCGRHRAAADTCLLHELTVGPGNWGSHERSWRNPGGSLLWPVPSPSLSPLSPTLQLLSSARRHALFLPPPGKCPLPTSPTLYSLHPHQQFGASLPSLRSGQGAGAPLGLSHGTCYSSLTQWGWGGGAVWWGARLGDTHLAIEHLTFLSNASLTQQDSGFV